jgi:hypothetical protein
MNLLDVQRHAVTNLMAAGGSTGPTDVQWQTLQLLTDIAAVCTAVLTEDRPRPGRELAAVVTRITCLAHLTGAKLPDVDLDGGKTEQPAAPVPADSVHRDLLIMAREAVKVGERWMFHDVDAVATHLRAVAAVAVGLAGVYGVDLPVVVSVHLGTAGRPQREGDRVG